MSGRIVMRWGVLWRSDNRLDGRRRMIMWNAGEPLLFTTRQKARDYIKSHYGYIKERPDLHREPHGWKMPLAVKVAVQINPVGPIA